MIDINLDDLIQETVSKETDRYLDKGVWEEVPVSPKEFFEKWCPPALSPVQLEVFETLIKNKEWNKEYVEYLLFWGEGCIAGNTILHDEESNKDYTVKELAETCKSIMIKSMECINGHYKFITKQTGIPFKKGNTKLYKVRTKSGKEIAVSSKHKFYTKDGWKELQELQEGSKIAVNSTILTFEEIESIEYIGEEDYYDLEVPDTHNYLAQGIVNHNSGKDFISTRMLVYAGYFLTCMYNPQRYFGMAQTEPIDLVNISVNAPHAKNVFFKRFTDTIKRVKNPKTGKCWFEEMGMDLRDGKDIQTTKVRFPKNITAHSLNSEKYSAEGNNILLAVFDEVAEFKPHKAKEIYDGLIYNAESRWGSTDGSPYRIILLSYLRHEHDFMNFRWKQSQHEERVYRSRKCTWEVRPDKTREDYNNAFKKNPEEANRRYANIMPQGSGNTFFQQKDKIREIINKDRIPPFVEDVYAIDDLNNLTLRQWFKPNTIQYIEKLKQKGESLPDDKKKELERLEEIHGDNRYYIHIDLAKGDESKANDCAGFVMVHPFKEVWDNEEYSIYVDFMMQIKKQKGEINFEAIRKFIYKLQDMGFNIAGVSLDGYQSVDFRQQMISKGLNCEIISMDRDSTPYNTVKELIYTDRIDYYEYKVVLRELEELIRDKDKVDHPEQSYLRSLEEGVERGSKDVADALAGSTFNALTNAEDEDADWFGV